MNPDFEKSPLIPAVVQDSRTGEVRMLGYMDREAYEATRETGVVAFSLAVRGARFGKGRNLGKSAPRGGW